MKKIALSLGVLFISLSSAASIAPGKLKLFAFENPETYEYQYDNPVVYELVWDKADGYQAWFNGAELTGSGKYFYHYAFEWDDEYDLEKACYEGDLEEAKAIVLSALNEGTGDSSQELGDLYIDGSTIVVPFSYIDETGANDGLEAVIKACEVVSSDNRPSWTEISLDDRADLLYDLEYAGEEDLPKGAQIVDLLSSKEDFSLEDIKNEKHRTVAAQALIVFDNEISREPIEQSPYSTYGDEEIIEFLLLVDSEGKVLAGTLRMYQDGRDQDGEDSDVNWQAAIRFDSEGELFSNENGQSYDDLYFEWSGH